MNDIFVSLIGFLIMLPWLVGFYLLYRHYSPIKEKTIQKLPINVREALRLHQLEHKVVLTYKHLRLIENQFLKKAANEKELATLNRQREILSR